MTQSTKEKVSVLRWLSVFCLILLFVSDFGFDVWVKPVPKETYWLIGSIVLGIDIATLRDLLLQFFRTMVSGAAGSNDK